MFETNAYAIKPKLPCKLRSYHADVGDTISFERKGLVFTGKVVEYRENTVVVQVDDHAADKLQIESTLTVVNHKHYKVI